MQALLPTGMRPQSMSRGMGGDDCRQRLPVGAAAVADARGVP